MCCQIIMNICVFFALRNVFDQISYGSDCKQTTKLEQNQAAHFSFFNFFFSMQASCSTNSSIRSCVPNFLAEFFVCTSLSVAQICTKNCKQKCVNIVFSMSTKHLFLKVRSRILLHFVVVYLSP